MLVSGWEAPVWSADSGKVTLARPSRSPIAVRRKLGEKESERACCGVPLLASGCRLPGGDGGVSLRFHALPPWIGPGGHLAPGLPGSPSCLGLGCQASEGISRSQEGQKPSPP